MLNIDKKKFYTPKIVICVLIWLYLVTEITYVSIRDAEIIELNFDKVRLVMRSVGALILAAYLVYFGVVSYLISKVIGLMKKSYKWLICTTLGVILISLAILFLNGQVQSDFDKPVLFVAQYTLYNVYMVVVAFLYSPCANATKSGMQSV